jgi:chromosome segregation ATPase
MKLYETYFHLDALWSRFADLISGEEVRGPDGEVLTEDAALEEIERALSEVEDARDQKALNIAAMVKNYRAEAAALKEEKARLAKRQQAAERTVSWLSNYLSQFLEPGHKLKDARATIGWRRSQGVKLTAGPDALPEEYVRIRREPNLSAIKEDLKNGDEVPGAVLEERHNIQVR